MVKKPCAIPSYRRRCTGTPGCASPDGGFFLVLQVPFVADEQALARSAQQHRVLWTPMSYFQLDGGGQRQLRLSASYLPVERIVEGVRRLREFIAGEPAAR